MSVFVTMGLTAIAAGLLVPSIAIVSARLGISDPFSLTVFGNTYFFTRKHRTHSANTSVSFTSSMFAPHIHEERVICSPSIAIFKIAA